MKAVNAQVKQLAPALNSPTVKDGVRVTSSEADIPVVALCKRHDGATYVFAVSMRGSPTTATFDVTDAKVDDAVEVLGEGRKIGAAGGKFSDRFDGYAVHLYRVSS